MIMNYFEKILLNYLRDSKLKMEITGFDMDGFQEAVREESKRRLEMVESIVFEDDDLMSDAEKVTAVKRLFQNEFYDKE